MLWLVSLGSSRCEDMRLALREFVMHSNADTPVGLHAPKTGPTVQTAHVSPHQEPKYA